LKERVVALGFVLFALVFVAGSISLKVGTMARPGPGLMPAAVGIAILVFSVYNAVLRFREKPAAEEDTGGLAVAPGGIAVATLVYPLLLGYLNYLLSTFLVLAALLLVLRFKSKPVAVATALVTTLVSFVLFAKLLGVTLPSGILEDLILGL
jgi:putative tricarboxylic transport membrane protein